MPTRLWAIVIEDVLPRLPPDSQLAQKIQIALIRTPYIDLTEASADTLALFRRALSESREYFASGQVAGWNLEFRPERMTLPIDGIIGMLAD